MQRLLEDTQVYTTAEIARIASLNMLYSLSEVKRCEGAAEAAAAALSVFMYSVYIYCHSPSSYLYVSTTDPSSSTRKCVRQEKASPNPPAKRPRLPHTLG